MSSFVLILLFIFIYCASCPRINFRSYSIDSQKKRVEELIRKKEKMKECKERGTKIKVGKRFFLNKEEIKEKQVKWDKERDG